MIRHKSMPPILPKEELKQRRITELDNAYRAQLKVLKEMMRAGRMKIQRKK